MQEAIQIVTINTSMADGMLHDTLYKGLKTEKPSLITKKKRYKGFDDLRIALRKIEKEREI